ncbi:membrane protein [Mycobacterium triplex]|uniref:Membrane protein n=1 Tax=Mycobacterium triplex TaxID=47839 RepID=A0A024K1L2_9MYCO|nr:membrane protein [Mycobacterium triplex]
MEDLEDRTVADRDPEAIKQEIDLARDQLAATVDSLAERANPRRLADDLKVRVIGFVTKPAVVVTLAGIGSVVVFVAIRRIRNR